MSDELLRKLEREVATEGSAAARIRLATELERRALPDEATRILFEALAAYPASEDVKLALGRFRGPPTHEWGLPQGDARNTRRSPARGPKGEGKILERLALAPYESALFTRGQDTRLDDPEGVPPPLVVGKYVYSSLAIGRRVLAATADGHVIAENSGASGFEWSANRDAKAAWRLAMPVECDDHGKPEWWSEPCAVIAPDATIFGVSSLRKLVAIEPTGDVRFAHELPAKVKGIALDADRGRLHVIYATPAALSIRDVRTGKEISFLGLGEIATVDGVIVCDDGRIACISVFGWVAFVSPDGVLERTIKVAEKISGAVGALSPWGDLVVVSYDRASAGITLIDPATGKNKAHHDAADCRGAPAIDATGTIYLDGGARCVMGFDLTNFQERYRLERPTLWRTPNQPNSQFALRNDELAYVEITGEGVTLNRVGA